MTRPSHRAAAVAGLALLAAGACRSGTPPPDRDGAWADEGPAPVEGAGPAADTSAGAPFRSALSRAGRWHVAWRPIRGEVPVNEPFELEVLVTRSDESRLPVEGAEVFAVATMPSHGHGMLREPRSVELGEGRYEVRGMLFHMSGEWELSIDVVKDGVAEGADFALRLARPFDESERAAILALSPLPPPPQDPTNAVHDDPAAARLGQALFFDPRFSKDGRTSCATCHDPGQSWTDGRELAQGATELRRNTPALWNLAWQRWFFWDGRADTLWNQALDPLEHPLEHAGSRLQYARIVHGDADLCAAYEAIFGPLEAFGDPERFPSHARPVPESHEHPLGALPPEEPRHTHLGGSGFLHPHQRAWDRMSAADQEAATRVFVNLGKCLAAFQRKIVSSRSPFDRFVEGLREDDAKERAALSDAARRGLRLFLGKARCHLCHSGPEFTDKEFHDTGVPPSPRVAAADAGRREGLLIVASNPFNGASRWSDDPGAGERKIAFLPSHGHTAAEFKTPTLRNVARTPPYMHQGQLATLEDVVRFYVTREGAVPASGERILEPLDLDDDDQRDLVAFLESLTDESLDPELTRPPESAR